VHAAPGPISLSVREGRVRFFAPEEAVEAGPETLLTCDAAGASHELIDWLVRQNHAADRCVEVTWWSEPEEFGVVYSDGAAIDHIVTNLVDNAVRMASGHVEVRLTRNPTHFFIRVWDDGRGIPAHYHPHLFDRGWTPEVASRQERISSGLGLFIGRTLARRGGGDILLESVAEPDEGHHTQFTLMLPMHPAPSQDRYQP
jgi:signal transduction histidine kinase